MSEIIEFENVSIYRKNVAIVENIYFSAEKGEFIFLFGKIGTGKTTLLKSIFAEIPIKSGRAFVLDFNLKQISKKQVPLLRRKIGFIFQDFKFLTDRNIYENLQFVLEATGWTDAKLIDKRIKESLEEVEMLQKKGAMPYELSGGEQQRIALSRALLNNPSLILADEPTGNLDEESSIYVTQKLYEQTIKNKTTVIFVSHDKTLTQYAKNYKILEISDKKIKQKKSL